MSDVAELLEDYQFVDNKPCAYLCHHCLRDENINNEMQNRSLAAQSFKYEFKNPSWISLLKNKILSS